MADYGASREWMQQIGKLGGQASAKRRLIKIPPAKRRLSAVIAARARWGKPPLTEIEQQAFLSSWDAGVRHGAGWKRREKAAKVTPEKASASAEATPPVSEAAAPSRSPEKLRDFDPIETVCQIPQLAVVLKASNDTRIQRFLAALALPRYRKYRPATLAAKIRSLTR